MKKNVASQSVGAQMITASDGTDFTGTVTCEVTVDGGTKTAGGGTVTHEGEGYHSYAPTQAETNGDHVAFSFAGTGAISVTVQIYTGFPQTVDNDVLNQSVDGKVDTAQLDLNTITGTDGVTLATAQGNYAPNTVVPDAAGVAPTLSEIVNGLIDETLTGHVTADSLGVHLKDILADVTGINGEAMRGTDGANTVAPLTAAGIRTAVGLASANMDTQFTASATATGFATEAKQDAQDIILAKIPLSDGVLTFNATASADMADAFLNRDMSTGTDSGTESVRTVRQALRFLRNKWSISGAVLTVTAEDDTTASWTAAVTTNAAADPITGNDPT